MALLKSFAKSESLPDPNGPLSSKLKPETIDSANRKVSAQLDSTGSSSTKDDGSRQCLCGSYMKFTPEQKAHVTRYALESGNKQAIVRYSKRQSTKPLPIKALPDQKQGRSLLLRDEVDTAVQAYMENI